MTLQIGSIEVLDDAVRVNFSLLLANSGDRLASGGLVRIALQQAQTQQTVMLERFFDGAGGSLLAEEVEIAPGDVGTVERNALLSLDMVEPLLIGGYPSLVPVMAFDVTYHWEGDVAAAGDDCFGQVAAAFVLGSHSAADARVAPVRLDLGPHRLKIPVAKVTEMQRSV